VNRRFISPLRYPGGKARVAPYIDRLMRLQHPRPQIYAEPFAGGAGAALRLLVEESVRSIIINDLSPGIAAFWRCVFRDTEGLASKIENAKVDLEEWHRSRKIFESPQGVSDLDLGFATFFLNRTNRSGILTARPIGGLEQTGQWKIDARFNRQGLAERVRFLGEYRGRVQVTQLDGRDFIRSLESKNLSIFAYVDPPYITQGDDLYLDSLSYEDHLELSKLLRDTPIPWMLTYDASARITNDLYAGMRTAEFSIAHTAQKQHIGTEYVVFSNSLHVENIDLLAKSNAQWIFSDATVKSTD
jgi:DNA adenine methylase